MARCRSCNALVTWAQTTAGKLMPLDAENEDGWDRPLLDREGGNVAPTGRYVRTSRGARVMEVEVVDQQDLFAGDERRGKYRSHFVTCPNASAHRKAR